MNCNCRFSFAQLTLLLAICLDGVVGCCNALPANSDGLQRGDYGPIVRADVPEGAIRFGPSDPNLASRIADAPESASFYFAAGEYIDLQIEPKAGQKFIGEFGARLTSHTKIYAFDCFDRPVENVTIENLVIDGYLPPVQACRHLRRQELAR